MKKRVYKLLALMLVAIFVLSGCVTNQPEAQGGEEAKDTVEANSETTPESGEKSEAPKEKVLTYVNFRDLRDLNPHLYGGELFAQNLVYEGLIKIEQDGSLSPWLAERYEVSEDGLTYIFKIREGVTFSDGVAFNAETAKANFDAILDNYERHGWLESVRLMQEVKEAGGEPIEVTGEDELTIHLSTSYYPFLVELGMTRPFRFTSPNAFIDGTTKNGISEVIGTGKYVLKENHVDEYAVFEANTSYWGEKAKIDKIIAKVIPDNQTRVLALESGEIDLIFGANMIDAESYNKFDAMDGYGAIMSEPVSTRMMIMNTTDEILSDVRVRQAIEYSTDREIISQGLFSGSESPAGTLLASTVPYADVDLEPYTYNLKKEGEFLDEAGWTLAAGETYRHKDGQPLEISLYYNSNNVTDKSISEFLQGDLAKIGIKLNIIGEEEQANRDRQKSADFQLSFNISWGTPYDPQSFIGAMRQPVYGDYFAQQGLENKEEMDEHILAALESVDEAKRAEHYSYVLKTLHEQAVYLPLTYQRNRAVFSDRVLDVQFNSSQFEVPMDRMDVAN